LTRYGLRETVAGSILFAAAAVAALVLFWPACIAVVALWALFIAFFRDPERQVPDGAGKLLSPADGTVRDVAEVQPPGAFLTGPAVRIGIFMSLFSVHVNRSPADGIVRHRQHERGTFHDARHPAAASQNEHALIGIETGNGRRIMVNQVAGAVARRIVCDAFPGQALKAGERYGMVKFGSRVELFVPNKDQFRVEVKPGDRVKAGVNVLVTYLDGGAGRTGSAG
jgi:phosphatidylserine decarboxylase